jgi:uncharacterized membrane protein (DUF4010 family)
MAYSAYSYRLQHVQIDEQRVFAFAAALGAGLLIGIERERRKGTGAHRALAGVRTFTLVSLAGAASGFLGSPLLEFAGAALVAALGAISHWRERSRDPGVTTEIALFITYLIGLIAIRLPVIAAGASVLVAGLLAARRALHRFSVELLTESELRDGLLLAALALIVLPLLPDAAIPWLGASPRRIVALVVTFLALQASGYVALRIAGPRLGLALSALVSGFVTSTGTIAALGTRSRSDARLLSACVSGALFSCIATVVLLAIVVAAVYPPALVSVGTSLALALIAALAAAMLALLRQQRTTSKPHALAGRPFNILHALGFAAILVGVTAVMRFVNARFGYAGAEIAAALSGVFDVHASATSTLSLAASGALPRAAVLLPILVAFSTNTLSKLVAAFATGGIRYGLPVGSGLVAIALAAWAPLLWLE